MHEIAADNHVIISLMALHLLASLATSEMRRLKSAIIWLMCQSALLACIFAAFGYYTGTPWLYVWVVVCLITKVCLIPLLLWHYSRRMPAEEHPPLLGLQWSILVVAVAVVAGHYWIQGWAEVGVQSAATDMAPSQSGPLIAFAVIALGLYVLSIRRDAFKLIIGVILMENGVHLMLVGLAPTVLETTIVGVTTNCVVLVWLLVYLTAAIQALTGTTDITKLSRLKR